jgi:drug/metabolite transporter (DMT)-like permease
MKNKPLIMVLAAGTLWGFMGVFARHLNSEGFGAMEVAQGRITTGLILTGLYLLLFDQKSLKVRLKDVWCFLGSGIGSVLFFAICYFNALNYTSLAVASILAYTAPIFVMIMSLLLFKEKMSRQKVIGLFLAFFGCVFVSGIGEDAKVSWTGILLGLGSGFAYALYSIFGRYAINRGYGAWTLTFYSFLFCSIGCAFLSDWDLMITTVESDVSILLWILGLGFITAFLPYVLYSIALEKMESSKATILASVEPVVGTLCGVFVFHEPITILGVIGIAMVLGAIVVLNTKSKNMIES